MEKRLIIAFALTILVFIVFQKLQPRNPYQTGDGQAAKQVQVQDQSAQKAAQAAPAEQPAQPASVSPEDTTATAQKVTVKGDLYKAVIDNRGAVFTSWTLNKYRAERGPVFEMIEDRHEGGSRDFPMSLIFDKKEITSQANNSFYQVLVDGQPFDGKELVPPVSVVFRLKKGNLAIEKQFSFEKDNYIVNLSASSQLDGKPIDGKLLLGQDIGPNAEHVSRSTQIGYVYFGDDKANHQGMPKDEVKKIEGSIHWVGLEMEYFAIIAIPSSPISSFETQKITRRDPDLNGNQVDRDLLKITAPINGSLKYQLYIGPKMKSNLDTAGISGAIDYGKWLSYLVIPLLAALRWIHGYVPNYGFAIVILTFFLSLLLFPLRLKQMFSMKEMQAVQPKVKAIQEKYRKYKKTDPKRAEMNQEIMALYKEHNVNPLGGCLTLLPQLPLLFAFYALLAHSIELRQAPFIFWIHDLSIKDPYWVLPIVMGITSFISQKMTPMTAGTDPAQAKVMMFMPAIFTIMFINLSSGLNLYFLCSNIFQVGFQKIAERWIGGGSSKAQSKS